ncbi:hypothetical protein B0H14DRAFT_2629338 [Mycena olivaceomarginata]|nr:hypothetical protein B0H14DRAFT_2629338 [Mycena olivaceomarginata]
MYSGLAPNEDAPDNRGIPGLRRCIGQGFLAQHHTTVIDDMATIAHQSFEKQLATLYKTEQGHKPEACGFPFVVLAPRKRKNGEKNLKRERGLEENRVRSIPRAFRRCLTSRGPGQPEYRIIGRASTVTLRVKRALLLSTSSFVCLQTRSKARKRQADNEVDTGIDIQQLIDAVPGAHKYFRTGPANPAKKAKNTIGAKKTTTTKAKTHPKTTRKKKKKALSPSPTLESPFLDFSDISSIPPSPLAAGPSTLIEISDDGSDD